MLYKYKLMHIYTELYKMNIFYIYNIICWCYIRIYTITSIIYMSLHIRDNICSIVPLTYSIVRMCVSEYILIIEQLLARR